LKAKLFYSYAHMSGINEIVGHASKAIIADIKNLLDELNFVHNFCFIVINYSTLSLLIFKFS